MEEGTTLLLKLDSAWEKPCDLRRNVDIICEYCGHYTEMADLVFSKDGHDFKSDYWYMIDEGEVTVFTKSLFMCGVCDRTNIRYVDSRTVPIIIEVNLN